MMSFKVILENNKTKRLSINTIEECVDLEDCVNFVHQEFPDHTIEQIMSGEDGKPVMI